MLSRELAQNIVNKMMDVIPYNVNIMNDKGIIIGSGDLSRLGSLHNGALEALKLKSVIEIFKDDDKIKSGVNSPIFFRKKVIGVIGITGRPNDVRQFTRLVTVTAELLINQEYTLNKHVLKERLKEEFIYEWLYLKEEYDREFIQRGLNVGIDISVRRIVLVLEFKKEEFNILINKIKRFIKDGEECINLASNKIAILLIENNNLRKRFLKLEDFLNSTGSKVGISEKNKILSKSIKEAVAALEVGKKLYNNRIFYNYKRIKSFHGFDNFINKEEIDEFVELINKENIGEELLETFLTYIKFNGERKKISEELHIHRNTLNYRLERIEEITGFSFRNYLDLFQLIGKYIGFKLNY